MRTGLTLALGVLVAASLPGLHAAPATAPLKITAYINITSGCQKPTEQCLKDLAAKYPGRVLLEFVDFGQPEGRKRWTADGRHCLAIALNGSSQASLVYKGADLQVTFEMPAGHQWLHEELEAAVRQALNGVSKEDRTGPAITAAAAGEGGAVLADGQEVFTASSRVEAERIAATLQVAASTRALVQDDFGFAVVDGSAKVTLRGAGLTDLGLVAIPAAADAEQRALERFLRLIRPFPRVSRPFPGQTGD